MADAELVVKITGDASDLESAISSVSGQLDKLERNTASGSAKTIRNWEQQGKAIKEVGKSVDTITKPLQVLSAVTAAGAVASAKAAVDFENGFANVKKTVDGTPEELEKIKKEIIALSTTGIDGRSAIPLTTTQLNELAAAGGQLGIATENIADFTEVMAQMESATNLGGESGAQTLAQILNVTGTDQTQIRNVGSAIVDLGNNSATTEAQIADMALGMGGYSKMVRIGIQDTLGYSAAMSSMGIESQLGGSAIGRTWMAIETAVANGGKGLTKFAKYSGKSSKEFKEQWNSDSSGAFVGLMEGLKTTENLTLALQDLGIENIQDVKVVSKLAQGIDSVKESLDRANKAYAENTALQTEADAKSVTSANQMIIAKNNIVEAGRSIGESFLPMISNGSLKVAEFAQRIANMSDQSKSNLIGLGTTVIATGAIAKGVSGTITGLGNTIEAVGTLKKFKNSEGFAKFTSMIAAMPIQAKVATGAIVGLTAVAIAGYNAYQKYQYEQIHFAEGMSEVADSMENHASKWKELNALQWESKELQLTINSDKSSQEEIDTAKQRLEEIKLILQKEYGLEIDVDNTQLDETIEKAKEAEKRLSNLDARNLKQDLRDKKDEYDNAPNLISEKQASIAEAQKRADVLENTLDKLDKVFERYSENEFEHPDDYLNALNEALEDTGVRLGEIGQIDTAVKGIESEYKGIIDEKDGQIKKYSDDIAYLNQNIKDAEESAKRFADNALLNFADNFVKGADTSGEIEKIKFAIDNYNLSADEYAKQVSLIQNGVKDLNTAWEQAANGDGTALNNIIADYRELGKQFGETPEKIAMDAALIKEGFNEISEVGTEDINALMNSLKTMGESEGLNMTAEKLTEISRSFGLIPENKKISISEDGSYEIVDNLLEKLFEIDGKECKVTVTANGEPATATIDGVEMKISNYDGQTGTATLTAKDGASYTVNLVTGEISSIPTEHNTDITATDNTESGVQSAKDNINTVQDKEVKITVREILEKSTSGTFFPTVKKKAKGTSNFEGGLAMVNDQKGISDPRELIVDKGRAFIPQGKDVILPLSKGAKVYTASQTKAIMSGMGIPRYAKGKDNSDGFTNAKDDWTHHIKTHAVTTTQELEKWLELQKKYKSNQKDIRDIQEQIFSLQQKLNKEMNDISKSWVVDRAALNDWEEYGDTAIDAFNRIKDRNYKDLQDGKLTWDEYAKTISDMGLTMYDGRISQSKKWLEHEEKYNGMGKADYLAGIDRMRGYTEEYYAKGLITHREYIESKTELDELYIDKVREELEELNQESLAYISERSYFNDWSDKGDDPMRAYNDTKARLDTALEEQQITWEQYVKYKEELDNEFTSGENEQSFTWLDEQRKYFGMSDEDYAAGLERVKKNNEAWYESGIGTARKLHETITDLNHKRWDEADSAYDKMLQKQQEYVSDMRDKFSEQEQALRDSWSVQDRTVDMSEVQGQLDVYAGAVTDRGQQKYKDLEKQMQQLQRDEELYNLEVANNATIKSLEAEYEQMEASKIDFMGQLVTNTNIDVSGIVGGLTNAIQNTGETGVVGMLQRVLSAVENVKIENNNMTDNRVYANRISQLTPEQIEELVGGLGK